MRLNRLEEAGHWYRQSLRAKADHVPAHLTYAKLLSITVGRRTKCRPSPHLQRRCSLLQISGLAQPPSAHSGNVQTTTPLPPNPQTLVPVHFLHFSLKRYSDEGRWSTAEHLLGRLQVHRGLQDRRSGWRPDSEPVDGL